MKQKVRSMMLQGIMTGILLLAMPFTVLAATGVNVDSHSQDEIRAYFASLYEKHDFETKYTVAPVMKGPNYRAGKLSDQTLNGAVAMLNGLRYIAGVPADVQLKKEYNEMCQAGALLNAANDELSHYPKKPEGMDQKLYALGQEGCSSSNMGWASYQTSFKTDIEGWVSDEFNVSGRDPGHRRWCLNPSMEYTGFGKVGGYHAMYSFDRGRSASEYTGIAWPAQQMPTDFFNPDTQWSISFERILAPSAVSVKLERMSDGKTWDFSTQDADGEFLVSNAYYGNPGCVIFHPSGIQSYPAGAKYHVTVKEKDRVIADYSVHFFDLEEERPDPNAALKKGVRNTKITASSTAVPGKFTVKWKKSAGYKVDKFEVYRSTSRNSGYTKVLTTKNGTVRSTYSTKLKKGRTYYFKIRGVRTIGDEVVRTGWSNIAYRKAK